MANFRRRQAIYLQPWEEVKGRLIEFDEVNNCLVFSGCVVKLTQVDSTVEPELRGLMGLNISVLRTDMSEPLRLCHCRGQPFEDSGCASHGDTEGDEKVLIEEVRFIG
jgi:hypothetical protein